VQQCQRTVEINRARLGTGSAADVGDSREVNNCVDSFAGVL
jgi:hypothetical protein